MVSFSMAQSVNYRSTWLQKIATDWLASTDQVSARDPSGGAIANSAKQGAGFFHQIGGLDIAYVITEIQNGLQKVHHLDGTLLNLKLLGWLDVKCKGKFYRIYMDRCTTRFGGWQATRVERIEQPYQPPPANIAPARPAPPAPGPTALVPPSAPPPSPYDHSPGNIRPGHGYGKTPGRVAGRGAYGVAIRAG
jgi:hypothetical protein